MPSIYELTEELRELCERADRPADEDLVEDEEKWLEEVEAQLNVVAERLEDKLDWCERVVVEMKRKAEALRAESARVLTRARSLDAFAQRLDNYMVHAIMTLVEPDSKGRRRVVGPRFMHYLQKNPPSVDEDKTDVLSVPAEYVEYRPHLKKREIIAVLTKTGEVIPGVALKEARWGLRRK